MPRSAPLPPLDVPWAHTLRDVSTAEISIRELEDRRVERRIVHAPLPGVTREMCLWWMSQLDRTVAWEGRQVLAYRLWHPRDHIRFEIADRGPDGRSQAGSRFHVVEAFQADPAHLVDAWFDVVELGDRGFRMRHAVGGVAVIELIEEWEDAPGGCRWIVTQRAGATGLLTGPLSRAVLWSKRKSLDAWLRHNVEENGAMAAFLPGLFAREG